MGKTVRLLSIRGIPVRVHGSWLLIYGVITWTLAAGYFPHMLPGLAPLPAILLAMSGALLLFASVLVHELAHSFVALRYGLHVRGITLHVFGGVSEMADEPPSARAELFIALAGPLASFVLGGMLWALRLTGIPDGGSVGVLAAYVMTVNLAIGVFNLVPGFPLDGGRVLRALLWGWTRSLDRATYLASRVGVGVAYLLVALGAFQTLGGAPLSGLWLILIGLFLQQAATASYALTTLRESLRDVSVRDVMHATLAEAVPSDPSLTAAPGESAFAAFERASTNGVGRLTVVEGGRPIGSVSLKNFAEARPALRRAA